MALADLSFKLYTDSGLTILFSGIESLIHNTDLSDNPQDTTLYFGSNTADRILQATSNPGVDNVTINVTDNISDWAAATVYILGDIVEPTTPNGRKYRCTVPGTSHASVEPTWPTGAIGSTVTDNDITWTLVGNRHELEEITLALTEAELDTNVAGDPLIIGTEIESGVGNAVPIWIRVENAVTTINNNVGHGELVLYLESVTESEDV